MSGEKSVGNLRDEILALHKDCKDLAKYITNARSEISDIRPNDIKKDKIPRAGKELDAIVEATEAATNQIMTAAETIMSARVTEPDVVNDACMEIFEACSFQDITGQRIGKVVSTLEYIEQYLTKLTHAWGHENDANAQDEEADDPDDEASLLNGPALNGEGVDQDFIDNMFDEASPEGEAPGKVAEAETVDDTPDLAANAKGGEKIAQDDIDALFN